MLSVLISTFTEFEKWLRTAAIHPAHKTSFWQALFGSKPKRAAFNRKEAEELADQLHSQIVELEKQLHSADDIATTATSKESSDLSSGSELGGTLGPRDAHITASLSAAERRAATTELQEAYRKSKTDFLHRHILDYKRLFRQLSALSSGDSLPLS